jgi:malate/lactate dehydrogenase
MKIAIIGTGQVGSTIAYALVLKGLCDHLVLAGRNLAKARGDALDLQHTLAFCERAMKIESAPLEEVGNCDIPVVVGRRGVIRHLHPCLNRSEKKALEKAANRVKAQINSLLLPEDSLR